MAVLRVAPVIAAALALVGAGSCTPEIVAGAYFCGAEMSCSPGYACDGPTNLCIRPNQVSDFVCPAGSEDREPDDDPGNAAVLGAISCTAKRFDTTGCVRQAGDRDVFALTGEDCAMEVELDVTFAAAFEPVTVTVTDGTGQPVVTAEGCGGGGGDEMACASFVTAPGTTYLVTIAGADQANCDGACSYNRYAVAIATSPP